MDERGMLKSRPMGGGHKHGDMARSANDLVGGGISGRAPQKA